MKIGVQWRVGWGRFLLLLFCFVVFLLLFFFGGGGCERERGIEVIVKIKKTIGGGVQVRVDVSEELKFL